MNMLKRIRHTVEAYYVCNKEVLKPDEVKDLEDQIAFMDIQIKNMKSKGEINMEDKYVGTSIYAVYGDDFIEPITKEHAKIKER